VSILVGTGTGSFQTALDFPVGVQPTAVTVGDFNTDRRLDLAVSENGGYGGFVSILLNTSRRRIGGNQNK
jgi:FG-GAP-like repeat